MTRKKKLIWIGAGLLLAGLAALFAFSGDEADEAATPRAWSMMYLAKG